MVSAIIIAATVVQLLVGAIATASGIARNVIRAKYGKQLNQTAKKITPLLNSNESLRNQINTALSNQNSKLATDLLMASPLSSMVSKLTDKIQKYEQGMRDTDKHFDEQKELAEQTERDAQKIGSALDGDIASATEGKHAWLGKSGQTIRDNVSKLEQTQQDVIQQLKRAKKDSHIPSAPSSTPNSNTNIGVMDRTGTSPVPTLTMKGNN